MTFIIVGVMVCVVQRPPDCELEGSAVEIVLQVLALITAELVVDFSVVDDRSVLDFSVLDDRLVVDSSVLDDSLVLVVSVRDVSVVDGS